MFLTVLLFCGCQEKDQQQTPPPTVNTTFLSLVNSTAENLSSLLANMDANLYNFYNGFDWATNYIDATIITGTDLEYIQGYAPQMNLDFNSFENYSDNYTSAKAQADLTNLNTTQRDLVWLIDMMIADFNSQKTNVTNGIADMEDYAAFILNVATDLELTQNLTNTMTLLSSKTTAGLIDDAIGLVGDLKNITRESKTVHLARAAMGIVNYTDQILGSYDTVLDAWDLYEEYLVLFKAGDYTAADQKLTEYQQKFSQALSEGLSQSTTEINNQIDTWCRVHLGSISTIFEIYAYS
jgi:hypothetical protein